MKEVSAIPQSFYNPDGLNPFPTTTDEYLSGQIAFLWQARDQSKYLMDINKADMLMSDSILGELFFRQKRRLCRLGRGGSWLQWLKENGISRSAADRLVLEHAEFYGLAEDFAHRAIGEPTHQGASFAEIPDDVRSGARRLILPASGMGRRSSVAGLRNIRLCDIDLLNQTLTVRVGKNRFGTRILPLNQTAFCAVERLLERAKELGGTEPEHFVIPRRMSGTAYDPRSHAADGAGEVPGEH